MLKNIIVFVALIVALASAQVSLTPGITYSSGTSLGSWSYFAVQLSESTINYVQFVTTVDSGLYCSIALRQINKFTNTITSYVMCDPPLTLHMRYQPLYIPDRGTPYYYANIGSVPTFKKNIWKHEKPTGPLNKYFYNPNVDLRTGNFTNTVLYFGVYGYSNTRYYITANTQGPIQLYDRQVSTPSFPTPGTYVFYKLTMDSGLRSFHAVVQSATRTINYPFYMSNYTSTYPVRYGRFQYKASNTLANPNWCIRIPYPFPGSCRLGVSTSAGYNYTIQFVENGSNSCRIEK